MKYNLIVSGWADAWSGEPFESEKARVAHEYTDEEVRRRFEHLDTAAIEELLALPTLFAYEKPAGKAARLGRITRIRYRQGVVRAEYQIDPDLPPIASERLERSVGSSI